MLINDFFGRIIGRDDPPRDRRRSPRYPTVANWGFLAWRGGGRTRISPARLLNISGDGRLRPHSRDARSGSAGVA